MQSGLIGRSEEVAMSDLDDDFRARANRIKAHSGPIVPVARPQAETASEVDVGALLLSFLRPQLAFVLGAIALVLGRGLAMRYLGVEPSGELLSIAEGIVVLVLLVGIGLAFGLSDIISHCALLAGAALAFLTEGFYIPLMPDLMGMIYNPEYVAIVVLNAG